MIRLRTFVLASSVMVVCLAIALSWVQMKRLLEQGALALEEKELDHIADVVRASIETKKSELRAYARVIRSNNDLSSAYLIAKESGDIGLVDARLKRIKSDVGFDFSDILSPEGKSIHRSGLALAPSVVRRILHEKEGLFAIPLEGRPAFVTFSVLRLYEEPIAIFVMGSYPRAPGGFQGTDVVFATEGRRVDDPAAGRLAFPVEENLWVSIHMTESPTAPFWNVFSSRLILSAALSLVLLLGALYAFFEFGFMRGFRNFVGELETVSREVDRGAPRELPDPSTWILENGLLYSATQRLVRGLIAHEKRMKSEVMMQEGIEKQRALGEMASQVAHDIRSPLSALVMTTGSLKELPETHRLLIREAISRIQDIANDLLKKRKEIETPREPSLQLLSSLIETIVSEKRMQNRQHFQIQIEAKLDEGSYGLFAQVQPSTFKTMLSNILNNAVEAIEAQGNVTVSLIDRGSYVAVVVEDNGRGIPSEILPRLSQRGASFGKKNGSGLGLYHARTHVESWGGTLGIESREGEGTVVTLNVPKAAPPRWFVPEIQVREGQTLVIVDDDLSIHQIWEKRFEPRELIHFSTPQQLLDWQPGTRDILYLVDYEFIGKTETGLSLIETLGIADRSILVTSRFEEEKVVRGCAELGVRLLPKGMAGFVPIR